MGFFDPMPPAAFTNSMTVYGFKLADPSKFTLSPGDRYEFITVAGPMALRCDMVRAYSRVAEANTRGGYKQTAEMLTVFDFKQQVVVLAPVAFRRNLAGRILAESFSMSNGKEVDLAYEKIKEFVAKASTSHLTLPTPN